MAHLHPNRESAEPIDLASGRAGVPDFDARGRPLLYFAQPHGAYCPECVRLGQVPYGRTLADAVPRSHGVMGRCDACRKLCRAPRGPDPSNVAEAVARALNSDEALADDDAWASTRRASAQSERPACVELVLGDALYRCVIERVA